jgi:hypothetical protein
MLPPTCVVVPSYWTRPRAEARPGDAVYDHPTPLDGQSTLPALLDSLGQLKEPPFYLLVLVAVTGDDVAGAAEEHVRSLLDGYSGLTTLVFGPSRLRRLHGSLEARGLAAERAYLQLRGYPCIRNLQLAIPHALHASAIVALDDDEIVVDPDFLVKATEPLGTRVDGRTVDGLSGHYLQENGSILLQVDPSKARSPNVFDRKAAIMNAATEALEREPGTMVETAFCFGGNMEFTAELAAEVGFDPEITRGEDIDYLINARMEGMHFFLRKDLNVLHRPPRGGSYKDASRAKLEQDVIRFLYERAKLAVSQSDPDLHPVTADELRPYPGDFFAEDVGRQAAEALRAVGYNDDAEGFVRAAEEQNRSRIEKYLVFRRKWARLQAALHEDAQVRDGLLRDVRVAATG